MFSYSPRIALSRSTWVASLAHHPDGIVAVDSPKFLCREADFLQSGRDIGAIAEWMVGAEDNLRGTNEHLQRLNVHGIGRCRCVVVEAPQMMQPRIGLRR